MTYCISLRQQFWKKSWP